jgi:hypothetical protein
MRPCKCTARRPVQWQRVPGPVRLVYPHSGVRPGPVALPLLSLGRGGLRLSTVACLPVALADLCGYVWSLPRVSVSCVACVCLCSASALRLSAPMLLGVSLVPLWNMIKRERRNKSPSLELDKERDGTKGPSARNKTRCNRIHTAKSKATQSDAKPRTPNPSSGAQSDKHQEVPRRVAKYSHSHSHRDRRRDKAEQNRSQNEESTRRTKRSPHETTAGAKSSPASPLAGLSISAEGRENPRNRV